MIGSQLIAGQRIVLPSGTPVADNRIGDMGFDTLEKDFTGVIEQVFPDDDPMVAVNIEMKFPNLPGARKEVRFYANSAHLKEL